MQTFIDKIKAEALLYTAAWNVIWEAVSYSNRLGIRINIVSRDRTFRLQNIFETSVSSGIE